MPVIKSAIKKLKQDRKREKQNDEIRASVKSTVRLAKKSKSGKSVSTAISTIDKAVKNNIIHKNKAARLKSSLTKIAKPVSSKSAKPANTPKTATKETATKKTTTRKAPSRKK